MSDPPPLDRRESKSEIQFPRPPGLKGKMSFKTASHATITFLSAKKRIEGGLKSLGKRMSKRGSVDGEYILKKVHLLYTGNWVTCIFLTHLFVKFFFINGWTYCDTDKFSFVSLKF